MASADFERSGLLILYALKHIISVGFKSRKAP
jgi:hypothetical protein